MSFRARWVLIPVLAAALAVHPQPSAGETIEKSPFTLRFEPVSDGVILARRPEVGRFPVIGNAVIVTTGEGVVLVDGGGAPAVADQIVAYIRSLDAGPLHHLIVTHWHSDHTFGLDRYVEAFPGVLIVAHPWTHERMVTRLGERIEGLVPRLEEQQRQARHELESGRTTEGATLSTAEKQRRRQFLLDFESIRAEWTRTGFAAPHLNTDGGMTLRMPSRTIEVRSLGIGNTPGDLVVYLPGERVLIGGDIVTLPVPFGFPTDPEAVISTTETLLDLDFARLIPGHGPVQGNRAYIQKILALQRHAVAEIRRLHSSGNDRDAILDQLTLAPHRKAITGGDAKIEYLFEQWYRVPIVGRMLDRLEPRSDP